MLLLRQDGVPREHAVLVENVLLTLLEMSSSGLPMPTRSGPAEFGVMMPSLSGKRVGQCVVLRRDQVLCTTTTTKIKWKKRKTGAPSLHKCTRYTTQPLHSVLLLPLESRDSF